jgi:hypothetical protein
MSLIASPDSARNVIGVPSGCVSGMPPINRLSGPGECPEIHPTLASSCVHSTKSDSSVVRLKIDTGLDAKQSLSELRLIEWKRKPRE